MNEYIAFTKKGYKRVYKDKYCAKAFLRRNGGGIIKIFNTFLQIFISKIKV